jgi:arylsulfatase A-like enzyme
MFEDENLPIPKAYPTHQEALAWLGQVATGDAPFFLFINDMEPHLPYIPPEEFRRKFVPADTPAERIQAAIDLTREDFLRHNLGVQPLPEDLQKLLPQLYDAEIATLDHEIATFLDAAGKAGWLDNTLLVIVSDHGENLGRHGLFDHKFSLHRSLLWVPLLIRLPRGERAGEVRDEVVRLEDLFPTVLEVCGLPVPEGIDGKTLLGDLSGRKATAVRYYEEQYMEEMAEKLGSREGFDRVHFDLKSEFDGRYQRIEYSDGRTLVFDVKEDPLELHPLDE